MRIKKISPTTPANGNIENQYGTSQTNAYSEAYANTTFATKDVATTSANGLMSASDKTNLANYVNGLVETPLTTNLTTSFDNQANGTTQTFSFGQGSTDAPSSTASGIVISFRDTADWGWQIAIYNSIVAKRQKRQGTWGSWTNDDYIEKPITNANYFSTVEVKRAIRSGHVVQAIFKALVSTAIPNNTDFAYLPFGPAMGSNNWIMFGIGGQYSIETVAWGYVLGGGSIRCGGVPAGKWVHINITFLTD